MKTFDVSFVLKPWGYEYRIDYSEQICLTYLVIKPKFKTSLHCHPEKLTSLVSVEGQGRINFLNNSIHFDRMSSFIVRRGLFHQIENIGNSDLRILEFESPNDKNDLVRLKDDHGREKSEYEKNIILEKIDNENEQYFIDSLLKNLKHTHYNLEFKNEYYSNFNFKISDSDIVVIIEGFLADDKTNKKILQNSDAVQGKTFNTLILNFKPSNNFKILQIKDVI